MFDTTFNSFPICINGGSSLIFIDEFMQIVNQITFINGGFYTHILKCQCKVHTGPKIQKPRQFLSFSLFLPRLSKIYFSLVLMEFISLLNNFSLCGLKPLTR